MVATAGSPTTISAADILVTPAFTPSAGEQLLFSSSGFTVPAGQEAQYVISYTVDPPPPEIIHFASQMLLGATDPPGLAQVTTTLCVNAAFSDGACPSGTEDILTVFDNGTSSMLNASVDFSQAVGVLGIDNTITLDGVPGSPASFSAFGNTSVTNLPEPRTGFLLFAALPFFAFLARRARAKVR